MGQRIKTPSFQSHVVCSFVKRRSVSGPEHTAGSPSPLALLSGCHSSNLSPAPEGASGQVFLCADPVHLSRKKKIQRLLQKLPCRNRGDCAHHTDTCWMSNRLLWDKCERSAGLRVAIETTAGETRRECKHVYTAMGKGVYPRDQRRSRASLEYTPSTKATHAY